MEKSADAFRTISEVADDLSLPQHVLRFWETRFPQIRPLKRAGGRRYYRPADVVLLRTIRQLLYENGYTIKGVQRLLKEQGAKALGTGPRALEASDATPDDIFDSVETQDPPVGEDTTVPEGAGGSTPSAPRALVEEALATIEGCKRILDAVLRPPTRR